MNDRTCPTLSQGADGSLYLGVVAHAIPSRSGEGQFHCCSREYELVRVVSIEREWCVASEQGVK